MSGIIEARWSAPKKVRALCTTRQGGFGRVPYDSFNLAMHVGDDSSDLERNRERLRQSLKLPDEPCWLEQTHSTNVVKLDQEANRSADAAITSRPDTVAVVMTADCLPILLCNRSGTEVAVVHAGWRGLVDGVVQAVVERMDSPANQLLAWIGPAISPSCFEVGDEVRNEFLHRYAGADEHFVTNRAEHWLCDLSGLAMDMLEGLGVSEIHNSSLCSYSDEVRFFSYRRNHPTGRMASLIWIDSNA